MKALWFDTETTGLNPNEHEIIQLSYQMRTDDRLIIQRDLLMKPEFLNRIEETALEIQGRTKEDILDFPDRRKQWDVFMMDLAEWIDRLDRTDKCWYAGYNIGFDIDFLWGQIKRWDIQYFGSFFFGYRIDPYPVIQYFVSCGKMKPLKNYKLETVCSAMGIELKAHDAASDVEAVRLVAARLIDYLK